MRKKMYLFAALALPLLLASCSDDDNAGGTGAAHDPTVPVTVSDIMPRGGMLREKVIVKGSNFGHDRSRVSVYFVDASTEREATVIGVDNTTLYCLAPRQLPGANKLHIKVASVNGTDTTYAETTSEATFLYEQAQNVTTICGAASKGGSVDGTLAEAKLNYMWGVAAMGDGMILTFQRQNSEPRVRLISVDDNKVTTVHNGFKGGKPAITKDRRTVYDVGWDGTHTIYAYTKETGWSPMRKGQLGTEFTGKIAACALDANDTWLYVLDSNKNFGRFNVKTQETQLLKHFENDEIPGSFGSTPGPYLIYYFVTDRLYFSDQNLASVYSITMPKGDSANADEVKAEWFAGSSTQKKVQDGLREEATFAQPNGMTVDEDGNMYIVDGFNGYCLRKLDVLEDYVSTVAGQVKVCSQIDGTPLEATFNYPYDISYDGEGGFYIAEGWGCAVRKYAVE